MIPNVWEVQISCHLGHYFWRFSGYNQLHIQRYLTSISSRNVSPAAISTENISTFHLTPAEYKQNTSLPRGRRTRLTNKVVIQEDEMGLLVEDFNQFHRLLGFGRVWKPRYLNILLRTIVCCRLLWCIPRDSQRGAHNIRHQLPLSTAHLVPVSLLQKIIATTSARITPPLTSEHSPCKKFPWPFPFR